MDKNCNLETNHVTFHDIKINVASLITLSGGGRNKIFNAWISTLEKEEPESNDLGRDIIAIKKVVFTFKKTQDGLNDLNAVLSVISDFIN